MDLVLSTERGIEWLLEEELKGAGHKTAPFPFLGRVRVADLTERQILKILYTNPLYHKAYILFEEVKLEKHRRDLDTVYWAARNSPIIDLLSPSLSFGVKCNRKGHHPYQSQEIASYIGAGIIDGCRTKRGFRPKVNLKDPDLLVAADAFEKLYMGVELVGLEGMHHRGWRIYNHPAALKSTLANALIRLSGYGDGMCLWDPMCGSGTIPIEAAHRQIGLAPAFFRKKDFLFLRSHILSRELWSEITHQTDEEINWHKGCCIFGSDRSEKHIKGALINAESALVERKIRFYTCSLSEFPDVQSIDTIVCNPPYGIRMGNPKSALKSLKELFITFAESKAQVLVMIHPRAEQVQAVAETTGSHLDKLIKAYNGNVEAFIMRFVKT